MLSTHEQRTRNSHLTAFYRTAQHHTAALEGPQPSMRVVQMAHIVYDHQAGEFTKCRDTGDTDLLNALLLVERNRHKITDSIMEAVQHVRRSC